MYDLSELYCFANYRTGAERSCLYCAVSVLIEKMEIEHEVSVVNTLRQIKAKRLSAISSVVMVFYYLNGSGNLHACRTSPDIN